ncbi:ATP-binding protein [Sinosporangium album]|nr:tetratricopeptide repeat protein [Sinosporangium album]
MYKGTHTHLSGNAGDVVQAGNVHGGVHFHGAATAPGQTPRELPGDVRSFVNREDEIARLDRAMNDGDGQSSGVVVAVIAGTAGVGKTSLALHWSHRVQDRFPDGQLYVNLRGYDPGPPLEASQVLERFLRALGVKPAAIPDDLEARSALYRSLLARRRMLVVLDNAVTVGQVRPLLPGTATCMVLVTSRSRLSGLVARDGADRLTLGILSESDAVDLLRRVTTAHRSGDAPEKLAELSGLCAGLPLALRIAAERAVSRPWMPLSELIAELRDESGLWEALTIVDGEEGDAVRAVFAWSYRALPEGAAHLFRLLGSHPGADFGAQVAAAMARRPLNQVRSLLDLLVGAHLLEQNRSGRYQFHDLLRAYATGQGESEELPENLLDAEQRMFAWYLHGAAAAQHRITPQARPVPLAPPPGDLNVPLFRDYGEAIAWYEAERRNLVDVTRMAVDTGSPETAWCLSAILKAIYARLNDFHDWFETGQRGLEAARALGDRFGEAENLDGLAMAYTQFQRPERAAEFHRGALGIRREIGDRYGEAMSLNGLGLIGLRDHRLRLARSHFEQSVAIFRDLGEARREALVSGNLGQVYAELGEYAKAETLLDMALEAHRSYGDAGSEGNVLRVLSMTLRESGRASGALPLVEAAVAIAQSHGNRMWEGYWLIELGDVQQSLERFSDALVSYQHAAVIQRTIGDRTREARAWNGAGQAYRHLERFSDAADFHRRAASVHRELGNRWFLAVALDDLAAALAADGALEEARRHWREALDAYAEFDDPRSTTRQEALSTLLSAP